MTERPMAWNDNQIAALKELVAKGYTSSQIGAVLGCSRNAVIGKVHRLGVSLIKEAPRGKEPWTKEEDAQLVALDKEGIRHTFIAAKLGRSLSAISHRAVALGMARQFKPSRERAPMLMGLDVAQPIVPHRPQPSRSGPIPFLDSVFGQCKWPCWDNDTPADERMVCGDAAVEGQPYCRVHFYLCYKTGGRHAAAA